MTIDSLGNVGIGTTNTQGDILYLKSFGRNRVTIETQDGNYSGFRMKNAIAEYFVGAYSDFFEIYDNTHNIMPFMIDALGRVCLGMSAVTGANYKLNIGGSAYCTGSWQSSDIKFKKDIMTIKNALKGLLALRGVSFEWKTDEYSERGFAQGRCYGVVAQELEKIFPEAVNCAGDGEKAVSYTSLIPILIEAIKEQQTTIEGLEIGINRLADRVKLSV